MTHVEERLQQRFGINGITPSKLKYYTLNYGDLLFTDKKKNADFYILELEGKTVYPVVVDGYVVTVYWSSYIQGKIKSLFHYDKKKMDKIMKRTRR